MKTKLQSQQLDVYYSYPFTEQISKRWHWTKIAELSIQAD